MALKKLSVKKILVGQTLEELILAFEKHYVVQKWLGHQMAISGKSVLPHCTKELEGTFILGIEDVVPSHILKLFEHL